MDYSEQLRGLVPQDTTHEAMQRSLGDGTDWRMRLEFMKMLANYIKSNAMGQPGGEWVNPDRRPGSEQPGIYATPENEMLLGEVDAWHGSPHKFEKFAMSKIGTGEGAQAFGHGLYFTSQKNVAKHYATPVVEMTYKNVPYRDMPAGELRSVVSKIADNIKRGQSPFTAKTQVRAEIERSLRAIDEGKPISSASKEKLLERLDAIKNVDETAISSINRGSNVYKTKLWEGKDEVLLDWDKKPDKSVIEKIQAQLKKESSGPRDVYNQTEFEQMADTLGYHDLSGDEIYAKLSRLMRRRAKSGMSMETSNKEAASALLDRAGIDGIRYPAGSLSGGGKGYNYVVFDEEAIKIK